MWREVPITQILCYLVSYKYLMKEQCPGLYYQTRGWIKGLVDCIAFEQAKCIVDCKVRL